MSRIFITGSADGLGKMAAALLVADGHKIILHARDEKRARDAMNAVPGAEAVVVGDLSSIKETIKVAEQANALGGYDAIIHNAGVGYREMKYINTAENLPHVFAVNALAPYILTCLVNKPKRLVYTSSGLHQQGDPSLVDVTWKTRSWSGYAAYADSKLFDVILAFAVARKWPNTFSNAVEPGWVATKMGGKGAPDSLEEGPKTQVWLATSEEPGAMVSGKYFYHKKFRTPHSSTLDINLQERFLSECQKISGVAFPM